mgnify:CR=1 FL=1
MNAGFCALERNGDHLFVHLARPVRRFVPWGKKHVLPIMVWKAFLPGSSAPLSTGLAFREAGAVRQAWEAFDAHQAARQRWNGDLGDL